MLVFRHFGHLHAVAEFQWNPSAEDPWCIASVSEDEEVCSLQPLKKKDRKIFPSPSITSIRSTPPPPPRACSDPKHKHAASPPHHIPGDTWDINFPFLVPPPPAARHENSCMSSAVSKIGTDQDRHCPVPCNRKKKHLGRDRRSWSWVEFGPSLAFGDHFYCSAKRSSGI